MFTWPEILLETFTFCDVVHCTALLHDAAGYLHIIEQMKDLIKAAGKKSYTLVMGRPNSAKLANFPEVCYFNQLWTVFFLCSPIDAIWHCFSLEQCEVFIYVSCAQTALLDSKDFLAPVITPFEAVLAFGRYATLPKILVLFVHDYKSIWSASCGINLHIFAMVLMPEATCFQGKRVDRRVSFGFQGFDHFRETRSCEHNRRSTLFFYQRCLCGR